MEIKSILLTTMVLSGCSTFCPKIEVPVLPPATKIEISDELLKDCPDLLPLVINKDGQDPYLDILEAHKDTVLKYKECSAGKKDLNKIARKLANKEIK